MDKVGAHHLVAEVTLELDDGGEMEGRLGGEEETVLGGRDPGAGTSNAGLVEANRILRVEATLVVGQVNSSLTILRKQVISIATGTLKGDESFWRGETLPRRPPGG